MNWLLTPFSFEFMQQAVIISLIISVPASVISCLLVLKGWSLMSDAVSHAVLPGIVIAHIVHLPFALGAFIAGILCAVATGFFAENSRLKEDTVMGVVFSGMFALGLVLFSLANIQLHIDQILFGNILGLNWGDVIETSIITIVVLVFLLLRIRDIKLYAFDAQHAQVIGVNTTLLHYLLLAMLSLVIVASMKAVGIILVIAILIAPGSIAFLLTDRFESMILIAVAVGSICTLIGVFASYHINSAPAPTIVVLLTMLFCLVFLFAPRNGVLRKKGTRSASTIE